MKNLAIYLSLIICTIIISSCKKEKEEEPITPVPIVYPNFSDFKVGSYWIYQQFKVEPSGNATPLSKFDSCYIERDTVMNNSRYLLLRRPHPYLSGESDYLFYKDSLHYNVSYNGQIQFSSQDFETIFSSRHYIIMEKNDTVYHTISKMTDRDSTIVTSAGTFKTSNFQQTYNMFSYWAFAGNPRYINRRYAQNIGIILETLPFQTINPNYIERRLVRYHIEP